MPGKKITERHCRRRQVQKENEKKGMKQKIGSIKGKEIRSF